MNLSNDSKNSAYDGAGRLNHTIWRSKKFRGLQVDAKLALVYLIAGPEFSPSGIFTVDLASIGAAIYSTGGLAFLHNQGERVTRLLVDSGLIHYSAPTCWIPGVREFYLQYNIGEQIDMDVAKVLPGPVLDAYKAEYELGDSELAASSEMLAALLEVIKLDPTLYYSKHDEFAASLAIKYTAEQVREIYKQGGWWYVHDWRGKKGQPPTLETIRETIGPALAGQTTETTHSLDSFRPLIAEVEKLTSKGVSATDAKLMITSKFGEGAWKKLTKKQRWTHWRQAKEGRVQWLVLEAMKNE